MTDLSTHPTQMASAWLAAGRPGNSQGSHHMAVSASGTVAPLRSGRVQMIRFTTMIPASVSISAPVTK